MCATWRKGRVSPSDDLVLEGIHIHLYQGALKQVADSEHPLIGMSADRGRSGRPQVTHSR
jgi:hypothetical protein